METIWIALTLTNVLTAVCGVAYWAGIKLQSILLAMVLLIVVNCGTMLSGIYFESINLEDAKLFGVSICVQLLHFFIALAKYPTQTLD